MSGVTEALRRRLLIGLAAVGVLVTASVIAAVVVLQSIDDSHDELAYGAADRLAHAVAMGTTLLHRTAEARGYLLSGDPEFLDRRQTSRARFGDHLERFAQVPDPSPRLPAVHQLVATHDRASDRVMAIRARDADAAVQEWDAVVRPTQEDLQAELDRLIADEESRFTTARAETTTRGDRARRWMIAAGSVVVLLVVLLISMFVRMARELVAQHQREQRQEMFQLLEQVPVGIFVVTADGTPFYANHHARLILGKGIVPSSITKLADVYQAYEIGSGRTYPVERMPIVRALAGERSELSDMEIRREQDVIPLHVSGAPVQIRGELTFAVAAFQDVRELRRIANRDALTGLPNRAELATAFTRIRLLAERSTYPVAIALIDLDRFKAVNDTHGHAAGDLVLQRTAQVIVGALRRTDLVARWGGEELAALLPHTTLDGARIALEKARAAVRSERFSAADGATFGVTFSAGLVLVERGEELDAAIARADRHLYAAKHAGRDRISTASTLAEDDRAALAAADANPRSPVS